MITMTITNIVMIIVIIVTIVTMIVTREQIRELGTRESEVQRIFAGLRQAVSSKVFFYQIGFIIVIILVDFFIRFVSLRSFC